MRSARLSAGRADDLLTTVALATPAPLLLAPAMNQQMWAHAVAESRHLLLNERGPELLPLRVILILAYGGWQGGGIGGGRVILAYGGRFILAAGGGDSGHSRRHVVAL